MLLISHEGIEEAMKELAKVKKELEEMEIKNESLTKQNEILKEKAGKYMRETLSDRRKIKMYKAHIYATMLNDAMTNDVTLKAMELNVQTGYEEFNRMLKEYYKKKETEIICQVEGLGLTFDRFAENGRVTKAAEMYEKGLEENKENVKETIDELEKSGMIDLALKII